MKYKAIAVLTALLVAIMIIVPAFKAYAGNVSVSFDKDAYDAYENADFNIEVSINASGNIGYYHIELVYDAGRLNYVSGADASSEDGRLILEGTGYGDSITYNLRFHSAHSGPAGIAVDSAELYGTEADGYDVLELEGHTTASIKVRGDDILEYDFVTDYQEALEERLASEAETEEAEEEAQAAAMADTIAGKAIGMVSTADGRELYVVDHSRVLPADVSWNYELKQGTYKGKSVTYLEDSLSRVQILYLMDEEGQGYPYAIKGDEAYPVSRLLTSDGKEYLYVSAAATEDLPEGLTAEDIYNKSIVCAIGMDGGSEYYSLSSDNELHGLDGDGSSNEAASESKADKINVLIIFAGVFALITLIVMVISFNSKPKKLSEAQKAKKRKKARAARARKKAKARKKAQKRKEAEKRKKQKDTYDEDVDYVDLEGSEYVEDEEYSEEEYYPSEYISEEASEEEIIQEESEDEEALVTIQEPETEEYTETAYEEATEYEKPVISVRNVTMKFKISTGNASGLKEYLIQLIKKQVKRRELVALDNVSFDAYKGEVIGIIGTNGSGKSTILRIVSGALTPTGGRVVVDKSKVQLLTLGTGFDMELTARENIYLNGAIIGYSKKFIDEHFDEIVEFAELEDFVDDKVKNFSSGMVSRLGFAIATVGDTAEILILDEVLSVGDEFFKKKSLARVKEMIHGGSTVLMVSHATSTIIDNCSKVVWIEKGKLQMVGDAKIVCAKYHEMGGT